MIDKIRKPGIRNKLMLLLVIIFAMGIALCGCGGGSDEEEMTLEKYVSDHPEIQDEIDSYLEKDSSVDIKIEGNNLVYTYDTTQLGITEEMAKGDEIKEALNTELDKQEDTFMNIVSTFKDETGIDGIHVIVEYNAGDYHIVSRSFPAEE